MQFPQQLKIYFQSWGNYAQTFMKYSFPNIRYKMIYNIILQSVEKLNDFRIDLSRMNLNSSLNTKYNVNYINILINTVCLHMEFSL